jgi:hypothetical protein
MDEPYPYASEESMQKTRKNRWTDVTSSGALLLPIEEVEEVA